MAKDDNGAVEQIVCVDSQAPETRKERRATYRDVLNAPPNMVAEILDGRLYTHPRPAPRHAWASSGLGSKLGDPFNFGRGGPGGWLIVDEPELHLGDDIVVPDLGGWRRRRMPELPDAAYFALAPDWVCEVLSPGTRALDRGVKQAIYAREGVPHLWFVDPTAHALESFVLRDGQWVPGQTLTGDAQARVPPFDAIAFNLQELWSLPPMDAGESANR